MLFTRWPEQQDHEKEIKILLTEKFQFNKLESMLIKIPASESSGLTGLGNFLDYRPSRYVRTVLKANPHQTSDPVAKFCCEYSTQVGGT